MLECILSIIMLLPYGCLFPISMYVVCVCMCKVLKGSLEKKVFVTLFKNMFKMLFKPF